MYDLQSLLVSFWLQKNRIKKLNKGLPKPFLKKNEYQAFNWKYHIDL